LLPSFQPLCPCRVLIITRPLVLAPAPFTQHAKPSS
jgi:hypothetical protein